MKICHVTSSHNRYDTRILKKESVSLAKKYDVTLLCADNLKEENFDNVKIVPLGFNPKNRFERFFKVSRLIYKKALQINATVYHIHDPELLSIALKLKKNGKIVIFDSHEDNVNRLKDRTWIPKCFRNIVSKLYSKREKKILKNLDAVITVTDHIYERLVKINSNTFIVTNYPVIENSKCLYNEKNKNILCFAGGISKQYMHHNVLKAIEDIDDIKYYLAGKFDEEYFHALEVMKGFDKVEYVGVLKKDKVLELYNNSGIGLVLIDYTPNINYHYGSRGVIKIFEFMEAGLPVICTDLLLWKKMMKQLKFGIYVNPHSVEEIKNAIKFLITNSNEAKKMGQNGRKLVEKYYNWGTQEAVLFEIYDNIDKK